MSRWLAILPIVAVSIQPLFGVVANADESDSIHFHDDYNKALREAKLTGKPIFLEFRCAP